MGADKAKTDGLLCKKHGERRQGEDGRPEE